MASLRVRVSAVLCSAAILLIALGCGNESPRPRVAAAPQNFAPVDEEIRIDVWYGDEQRFGLLGVPVPAINILGNVSSPDGQAITFLEFSLNGGSRKPLSIGPDRRRLAELGDFNIDIPVDDLLDGMNTVEIVARDDAGNEVMSEVITHFFPNARWPLPFTADWSMGAPQELSWVVDGLWTVEGDRLRTMQVGYDRFVAIGDRSWSDYEVVVPITIHRMDPSGFDPPSNGPSIGIGVRWPGHRNERNEQPSAGFLPLGALGWYRFQPDGRNRLQILGNHLGQSNSVRQLEFGETYLFKMRVESNACDGAFYRLKVWRATEPEPSLWDIEREETPDAVQSGCAILIAHHVDASFGTAEIVPVEPAR